MNWKESLTKGYKHMTIPRKTVLIFAAVLVLPLLVVTVIWTENQVGKAYRTFETTSASELAQINAGVCSVLSKAGNTITTALDQRNFLTFCNSDMEADGLRLVQFSKNELERMDGIFQSNTQLSGASFYFDNPNVREIWDTIYSSTRIASDRRAEILPAGKSEAVLLRGITKDANDCPALYRKVFLDIREIGVLELRFSDETLFDELCEQSRISDFHFAVFAPDADYCFSPADDDEEVIRQLMENVNDQLAANALKLRVGKTVYWLTYEYLPEISAYMLCYAQADTLTGNLPRIILIVGCILIAFLLLVFLFSKAMYRSILKRLETLVTSMQAVEKNGDLSIRIPEPNAPGDELDTLSRQFNAMLDRTQQLMEQNVQSRLAAKDAQLHALQSQIDSHFLYNALESVRMMAETKHETELSDTLYALGSLLRYNMSWKTQNVTLKDEIDNIRKYIYLINIIHNIQAVLDIDIPPQCEEAEIPKLSLQPLVENSIVHGLPAGRGNIHISVKAVCGSGALAIRVLDDGIGIKPETMAALQSALDGTLESGLQIGKNGIGIVNVHKRFQVRYGMEYGLTLQSEPGAYTEALLTMPFADDNLGGW